MTLPPAGPISVLEARFAGHGSCAGALAVGFGRAAIYLALEAAGVRGGKVLVPDLICSQVLNAIRLAGAEPVFFAVPLDLAVAPAGFVSALDTPSVRAAILVHYFGSAQPATAEIAAHCREHRIPLIEDCALAFSLSESPPPCGRHGDFAAFSFTKNHWCDGGGMVIARHPEALAFMKRFRDHRFRSDPAFCAAYGRLSRLDYDANRPSHSAACAEAGHALQTELARLDRRFQTANFFDAASCDLRMASSAAERALRLFDETPAIVARREVILSSILNLAEQSCPRGFVRLIPSPVNHSFLVAVLAEPRARQLIDHAATHGVTLRPAWCEYQPDVPSGVHLNRIAICEIHPDLDDQEVRMIARALCDHP